MAFPPEILADIPNAGPDGGPTKSMSDDFQSARLPTASALPLEKGLPARPGGQLCYQATSVSRRCEGRNVVFWHFASNEPCAQLTADRLKTKAEVEAGDA
jgi:hypothetical protein